MQAYVLLIIISALLCQELSLRVPSLMSASFTLTLYLGLHIFLMMLFLILGLKAAKAIRSGHTSDRVNQLTRRLFDFLMRSSAVLFLVGLLGMGWPDALYSLTGQPPVLSSIYLALPSLMIPLWMLLCAYPMDRATRENAAAHLRSTRPHDTPPPIWSLGQYLNTHLRIQLLVILIPLILLVLCSDLSLLILPASSPVVWVYMLQLSAALLILLWAPWLTTRIFETEPIPPGELRQMLTDILTRHQVKLREIYCWKTHHMIFNGAVTGFVSRWRYILLTDVLLSQMLPKHIQAVMAHEIGHVKYKHMIWLVIGLTTILSLTILLAGLAWQALSWWLIPLTEAQLLNWFDREEIPWSLVIQSLGAFGGILLWLPCFGWLSRRYERQADTFAARHLSLSLAEEQGLPEPEHFSLDAVEQCAHALINVAYMNHIPIRKHTWRHGSIAWRVEYIKSLEGKAFKGLAIDRRIKAINTLLLIIFLVSIPIQIWELTRTVTV